MTMHKAVVAVPLVFAGLLLTACHDPESRSAPVITEQRDIEPFEAIDMKGDARLEITVGDAESLVVAGQERMVRRLSTEVHGDTLYIRSRRRDWLWTDGDPRVKIRITVPRLESLSLRGGNEVRLAGFDGGESRIKVEGAAHIEATGRLDELTIRVAGAGHADLSKLAADEAHVTVDGVGSVHVNARESLDATMNGVGAIFYSGSPREVNTSMNGLGTIARHDSERTPRQESKPEIDPDTLQPEYEETPQREQIESTEVI